MLRGGPPGEIAMKIDLKDVDSAQISIGPHYTSAKPPKGDGLCGGGRPPPKKGKLKAAAAPKPAEKPREYSFTRAARPSIPPSEMLTGMEIRLSNIRIIENGVTAMGPFGKKANLYMLSVAVDDLGGEPQSLTVKGFSDVMDGDSLPVDSSVYYWKMARKGDRTPGQIRLLASIVRSREALRDFGNALVQLQKKDDYRRVANMVVAAMAPGAAGAEQALVSMANIIGSILGKLEDKPLYTTSLSFTDIHGDFDMLGEHTTRHDTGYVEMAVSLTVRDVGRAPD
jgi:hypothetical protein